MKKYTFLIILFITSLFQNSFAEDINIKSNTDILVRLNSLEKSITLYHYLNNEVKLLINDGSIRLTNKNKVKKIINGYKILSEYVNIEINTLPSDKIYNEELNLLIVKFNKNFETYQMLLGQLKEYSAELSSYAEELPSLEKYETLPLMNDVVDSAAIRIRSAEVEKDYDGGTFTVTVELRRLMPSAEGGFGLSDLQRQQLVSIGEALAAAPLKGVIVHGYSDVDCIRGDDCDFINKKFSRKRAELAYSVLKQALPRNVPLDMESHGAYPSKYGNPHDDRNRRVEIEVQLEI